MKYIGFDLALPNPVLLSSEMSFNAVYLTDAPPVESQRLDLVLGVIQSWPEVEHQLTVVLEHNGQNWTFNPDPGYQELEVKDYHGDLGGLWVVGVEDHASSPGLWVEWGLKSSVVPESSVSSLFMLGAAICLIKKFFKN